MAALNEFDVYICYRSTALLDGEAVKSADQHLGEFLRRFNPHLLVAR